MSELLWVVVEPAPLADDEALSFLTPVVVTLNVACASFLLEVVCGVCDDEDGKM